MDNFASLDTPGDPGGVKVVELSGMKPKSADLVTVMPAALRINVTYLVKTLDMYYRVQMLFRMMCKCIIHNNSKLDSHDPPFDFCNEGNG